MLKYKYTITTKISSKHILNITLLKCMYVCLGNNTVLQRNFYKCLITIILSIPILKKVLFVVAHDIIRMLIGTESHIGHSC